MTTLADEINDARRDFYHLREMLKDVHTREEFEALKARHDAARQRLLEMDPEFREMVNKNRAAMRQSEGDVTTISPLEKAEHYKSIIDSKLRESQRSQDESIRVWVEQHKLKKRAYEEATKKDPLICPICYDADFGNRMNDVPVCLKCRHELIPSSELKKYNRDYRRNWKRRMKTLRRMR